MSIRLICAADIHFGRSAPVVEAWERLVDYCVESVPDALLLAGDLADDESLFFEVYPILRKGVTRLQAAQIPVVVIAGNHDGSMLIQMQRSLGFYLLGARGQWERLTLNCRGRKIHIDGLSFIEQNPMSHYDLGPVPAGEPLIGMLHCDLDASSESVYSPVSCGELSLLPPMAWVLGHIHVPRRVQAEPLILSCGSLQGLDITEVGVHGAWLLDLDVRGGVRTELIPFAPLRWEIATVDMTELSEEDWEWQLQQRVEQILEGMPGRVRLILQGRTPLFRRLRERPLVCPEGVESIENRTQPPLDLKLLAQGSDLPALLARQLLAWEEDCVAEGQVMRAFREHSYLKQAPDAWPSSAELSVFVREQGLALLDELLEQKRAT